MVAYSRGWLLGLCNRTNSRGKANGLVRPIIIGIITDRHIFAKRVIFSHQVIARIVTNCDISLSNHIFSWITTNGYIFLTINILPCIDTNIKLFTLSTRSSYYLIYTCASTNRDSIIRIGLCTCSHCNWVWTVSYRWGTKCNGIYSTLRSSLLTNCNCSTSVSSYSGLVTQGNCASRTIINFGSVTKRDGIGCTIAYSWLIT